MKASQADLDRRNKMTEAFDEANRILYELRRDGLLRIPLSEFE